MQPERPIRPRWLRALGLALVSLAVSTFAWWPILDAYPHTQGGDGPQYHKMLEAARVSLLRYHEFPHWNPYECGGLPLWDNPQAFVGAPLAWISLLVDTTRTIEIWFIVHSALGFACMWLMARHELKLSRAASFVSSVAWALSGVHQQHYAGGHATFTPFLYFPLALLLWRRAEVDKRFAVGLGTLVAWMLYEGAVYPTPHLAILLLAESATRAWPPRRILKTAQAGAIAGVVAFGLSASRLLPVVDQLRAHKRPIDPDVDALTWQTARQMFTARTHERYAPGQQYVWPEFGAYIGWILLALALVGVAYVAATRGRRWILWLLAVSLSFMLGHAGKWAPWEVLHAHVFPFKEMRVPARFNYEVTLFFAACAGLALDGLSRHARTWLGVARGRAARVALVGIALLGAGDMISVGIDWFSVTFTNPPAQRPLPVSTRLYFGGAGLAQFIDQPLQNRGRLECWDEWAFGWGAPLWQGDVAQAKALGDDATVEVANRTQNTFTIDVDAKRAGARILVNSTYDEAWQTDVGAIADYDKALAVDVPAGRAQIHLRYRPRMFVPGVVVTFASAAALAAILIWRSRRRTSRTRSASAA